MEEIRLEPSWQAVLATELSLPYMAQLRQFLREEIATGNTVLPPPELRFCALNLTPIQQVRAVILGQDPYHKPGQAMGLAFSVPEGVPIPPSLRNIYSELAADLEVDCPKSGNLTAWAEQGVLLLNTVLTVRKAQPGSHTGQGWERFTDTIIRAVSNQKNVVFMLWGRHAQSKGHLIDRSKHLVLSAAHPSPFSASRGFFGGRYFSKTNAYLAENGLASIDWTL